MSAKKLLFLTVVTVLLGTLLALTPGSTSAAEHLWHAEYFNNTSLSGNPAVVRNDSSINFNWGLSGPVLGVRRDDFSVRWTRTVQMQPGRYRFTTRTDDGVRLWVNNRLIIDRWVVQPARTHVVEVDLPGGATPIRMEYFERGGYAEAHLSWGLLSRGAPGAGTAVMNGAYFLNVRTGPGLTHHAVATVQRGAVLTLLGYRNAAGNWIMVALPNGTQGWVHAGYVQTSVPVSSMTVWTQDGGTVGRPGLVTATVSTGALNVRSGPGPAYAIITAIPHGTPMTLSHRNAAATWVRATLDNGVQGWVHAGYIRSSSPVGGLPVWN